MRVAFYTLGCKLNQAETESLASTFEREGFRLVPFDEEADLYIVNTCTVTHVADRKSRHWLRLAKRVNPRALVVATGCYAQRSPKRLGALADLVMDNQDKENLAHTLKELSVLPSVAGQNRLSDGLPPPAQDVRVLPGTARSRSLIKIQDGCRNSCAYCIVPEVRPGCFSLPASVIVEEVLHKVALGYKEVVLTGTRIGSYHYYGTGLPDLIQSILRDTEIERIRVSSLQPAEVSSELLALWRDDRLCRHFHLALQSGSDAVLQRMNRGYSPDEYRTTMDSIREAIPEAAITTDIIVGFPGESEDEFEQSYSFCRKAGFADIHVFPFSPRPGTVAADMPAQISDSARAARNRQMLDLARSSRLQFSRGQLGRTMAVLWERETDPGSGVYSGLTGNYLRVFTGSQEPLSNRITPVRLIQFKGKGLWGEVVSASVYR